jgi:hypothetical protein
MFSVLCTLCNIFSHLHIFTCTTINFTLLASCGILNSWDFSYKLLPLSFPMPTVWWQCSCIFRQTTPLEVLSSSQCHRGNAKLPGALFCTNILLCMICTLKNLAALTDVRNRSCRHLSTGGAVYKSF